MLIRKLAILGLAICICLSFSVSPGLAANSSEASLNSNPYLSISIDDAWKYSPAIAYNRTHDEYLVVWEEKPDSTHNIIYGRRVTNWGGMLPVFVISTSPNRAKQPAVAYDINRDRYLVVWSYDSTGDDLDYDIVGRFIPWNGPSGLFPEFGIETSRVSSDKPKIAWGLAMDGYMIVWKNEGTPSTIAGTMFYANGTYQIVDITSGGSYDRDFPDVAYNLHNNEYLVVWDTTSASTGLDVKGLRVNAQGTKLLPYEFFVSGIALNEQHPRVAACYQADQYLVVFQRQFGMGTDDDIWGLFVPGDTSKPLSPPVFIEGTTGQQGFPDVTCNWQGTAYFAAWEDEYANPPNMLGIWAKWIYPNQTMGSAFEVVGPSDTRNRGKPAVAVNLSRSFTVWEHERESSGFRDLWGRLSFTGLAFLPTIWK